MLSSAQRHEEALALHQVSCDFERNFLRDVRSIFTDVDVAVADEGKTCDCRKLKRIFIK